MSAPLPSQRCRARYTGRVQGVGFRYTACRIALRFEVAGYVRNLHDGSVELVAEGSVEQLDRFLAEIAVAMDGYIGTQNVQQAEPTGEFNIFKVAF